MLRDERRAALNDVIAACRKVAHDYEDAARWTEDDALAALFRTLGAQRLADAEELDAHIRSLDDLPRAPDPDLETLEHLVTHAKGALLGSQRRAVLEECEEAERKLVHLLSAALRQDLPPATAERLHELQTDIGATLVQLAAAKS
jgi:uncharacterized protein (TIGR02284 family)